MGESVTEIYFPRPLMYAKNPEGLEELRAYLLKFDKCQVEKENNINLPFFQYAWAGGYIWTRVKDIRVKSDLQEFGTLTNILAKVSNGKRGSLTFSVSEVKKTELLQ
jgi:hypothetical protein